MSKTMFADENKMYSERMTLSKAFEKYANYSMFEIAYSGYTSTYTKILREVRRRELSLVNSKFIYLAFLILHSLSCQSLRHPIHAQLITGSYLQRQIMH